MTTTGHDSRREGWRNRTRDNERAARRDDVRPSRDGRTRAGSRRFRPTRLDGILLIVLVAAAGWLWYRSAIGVAYRWDWAQALSTVFASGEAGDTPFFLTGIYATLRLSAWGAVLATILGVLIGVGRYSGVRALRMFCGTYIQILRNIPPLVFIFIFYFFISSQLIPLLGLDALFNRPAEDASAWQRFLFGPPALWENLVSGVLCISFISAAYIAEVVRAGLAAIPRGQWEAGESLGIPLLDRYRFVIFPQALARIAPPLTGQYISLVKDSSIVSLISIQELTFVGSEIANSSGLLFEVWLLVAFVYFLLCLSLSILLRQVERRVTRHFHQFA